MSSDNKDLQFERAKMKAIYIITQEEGYRENAYYCSEGYPTIGIGKRIGPKGATLAFYEFTASKQLASVWLKEEILKVELSLSKLNWFAMVTGSRRDIILSMAYQLGVAGLLKFKNMIKAIERDDWGGASKQALDSKWAKQTPKRASRHARVLLTGSTEGVY